MLPAGMALWNHLQDKGNQESKAGALVGDVRLRAEERPKGLQPPLIRMKMP